MVTLSIDVYVKYQNRVTKSNTYVYPYAQEDSDHPDFIL